ncbi:MAG: S-methyl-5-thioribose-1-phosphate isomerase [Solirubrobacterales bacterium]|nr:S-methyl-5-thioribose-1-phosphate isomerase [Solirubrobacterales bacterium]
MAATRAGTAPVVALHFGDGVLHAIDQTELPWRERQLELRTAAEVADAIKRLAIRGAPLIGVAAAYGVALELARDPAPTSLSRAAETLRTARPTAVNLSAAVDRVERAVQAVGESDAGDAALTEARAIEAEEQAASAAIATHGAELLAGARRILTHCNTGALAAPGRGTALAVIAELAARGSLDAAIATESRPLLQGARLTVYELSRLGIPHELVVDSAAPGLIAAGAVDAVIVGCDRVAANGDVANKVGTYGLALAARAAAIPFVVAGPTSTIDLATPTGAEITIEERDPDEVRLIAGRSLTLPGTPTRNPAFDVTPAELVSALVTEDGVLRPPLASGR